MFKWLFLETGILNAILKSSPDGDITVFRLLLPFLAITFFVRNIDKLTYILITIYLFFFFQFISILVSSYSLTYLQIAFFGNYLTMIFIFVYTKDLILKSLDYFYRFLLLNYILLIISLSIQYFAKYILPNLDDPGEALNAWYWNENDASLALGAFIFISIYLKNFLKLIFWHIIAIYIIYHNGSRTVLIGISALILISLFFSKPNSKLSIHVYLKIYFILVTLFLTTIFFKLNYVNEYYQLKETIASLFTSIINLNVDSGVIGSLDVRAQLLIYSLIEFTHSWLLGIGAGNSITMLQIGKYPSVDSYAKSIHNMPIQILLELGVFLFISMIFYLKYTSRLSWGKFLFIFVSFSFMSLAQSGGFIANYYVLYCFIFALNYDAFKKLTVTIPSPNG